MDQLKKHNSISDEFIWLDEAKEIMQCCEDTIERIVKELNITTKKYKYKETNRFRTVFCRKELEAFKEKYDEFWEKYISYIYILKMCGSYSLTQEICSNIPKIKIPPEFKKSGGAKECYLLEDVNSYIKLKELKQRDSIPNEFVWLDEAKKITKLNETKLREIIRKLNITTRKYKYKETNEFRTAFCKKELENFRKNYHEFWKKYVMLKNIIKICGSYSFAQEICSNISKIKIPPEFKSTGATECYLLEDVYFYINKEKEKYISSSSACKLLNINRYSLSQTIKELNLQTIILKDNSRQIGLLKKDIYLLKEKQKDIFDDYITYNELLKMPYSSEMIKTKATITYKLPYYARTIDKVTPGQVTYHKRSEVQAYSQSKLEKKEQETKFSSIVGETNYHTYLAKLNVLDFKGFEGKPYSENKWNEFVATELNRCTSLNDKTIDAYIKIAATSCIILFNFLDEVDLNNKKEVYNLSTAQIKVLLKFNKTTYSSYIYKFLKLVSQDMILKKVPNSGFNIKLIENPYKKRTKNISEYTEDEIYSFNQYIEIFSFLTNIDLHLNKLKNIKEHINKLKYMSYWCYTSLQLTNTWRKSDLCSIPKFNWDYILKEEKIYNIEWFYANKVSIELGRKVISNLKSHEYIMDKNKQLNKFRASDELSITFATIFLILDILHKNKEIINENDTSLLYFATKYNEASTNSIAKFFNEINLTNFKFSNRKMTKSVMSYTEVISPAEYGILIAQHQRAHICKRSTQHYLLTPKEHMDFLSKQLFERGQFGYIYDALLDIVIGHKDKDLYMKERTEIIKSLREEFGDINKLESSLKLTVFFTQTEVIDMLYTKTLEECNEILTNIYFNNLPSRESHIQCLCSPQGCLHPEKNSYPNGEGCIACGYSIPNIYAITSLTNRLKEDFKTYGNTNDKILKRKLSMRIHKYKEVLKQAIKKFGKDYVYSCIGIDLSREEFINLMASVKPPSEIIKAPLNLLIERNN